MALQAERPRRAFSVDEYHRMAKAGIFGPGERVELIEGEIVELSPISPRHAGSVINFTRILLALLGERVVLSPQNPVVIAPHSEPQPDVLLLRPRAVSYSRAHPTPEDVLLAIEVADTTVRFDRIVKARLYARAAIAEFWLADLPTETLVVHRSPRPEGYTEVTTFASDSTVSLLAFPGERFVVADFFA